MGKKKLRKSESLKAPNSSQKSLKKSLSSGGGPKSRTYQSIPQPEPPMLENEDFDPFPHRQILPPQDFIFREIYTNAICARLRLRKTHFVDTFEKSASIHHDQDAETTFQL